MDITIPLPNSFFVYEHWRTDIDQIFYVGMGSNGRAFEIWNRSKAYKQLVNQLRALGAQIRVKIIHENLAEAEALSIETKLIKFWLDSGAPLVNKERILPKQITKKRTAQQKFGKRNKIYIRRLKTRQKMSTSHKRRFELDPSLSDEMRRRYNMRKGRQ
jgi:hypothetical protein